MLRELVGQITMVRYERIRQKNKTDTDSTCYWPIMVVRCEHHTGAGIGVTGDPGAVDGKHHEQHQHQHGDYRLDVGAQTLLCLLLLRYVFSHLAGLQGQMSKTLYTSGSPWRDILACCTDRRTDGPLTMGAFSSASGGQWTVLMHRSHYIAGRAWLLMGSHRGIMIRNFNNVKEITIIKSCAPCETLKRSH